MEASSYNYPVTTLNLRYLNNRYHRTSAQAITHTGESTCTQTQNEHAQHTVHLEVVDQTNRELVTGYHLSGDII